jgi:hypothetical protein
MSSGLGSTLARDTQAIGVYGQGRIDRANRGKENESLLACASKPERSRRHREAGNSHYRFVSMTR